MIEKHSLATESLHLATETATADTDPPNTASTKHAPDLVGLPWPGPKRVEPPSGVWAAAACQLATAPQPFVVAP